MMAKRRTHSSIDTLPADLRDTLTAMVVDGDWPGDWPAAGEGRPTYDDLAAYAAHCGVSVSRSAIGRWAKGLLAFERMRSAAGIARKVMGDLNAEAATETQKAADEIMTAQIIELIADGQLDSKDISLVSGAIKDCNQVAMQADKYIREQLKAKAAEAVKNVNVLAKKKNIDPETLRIIREEIYGIVN